MTARPHPCKICLGMDVGSSMCYTCTDGWPTAEAIVVSILSPVHAREREREREREN